MIGRTIGHYEIIEKIGEGGMGAVYKARDIRLDRSVALKMLPGESVANSERKRRFALEAKAASALNHPNIITIYDIDVADGVDFIAMEYVAGHTLADVIPPDGMEPARAIAVRSADRRRAGDGPPVRDRPPGPEALEHHGERAGAREGAGLRPGEADRAGVRRGRATHTAATQTREGTILGTVSYMAPEQAEGKPVDQRADIFSFGAVLYEMLSGVQPFRRDSVLGTLAAIVRDEPPALDAARIPPAVRQVVKRALEKNPEARVRIRRGTGGRAGVAFACGGASGRTEPAVAGGGRRGGGCGVPSSVDGTSTNRAGSIGLVARACRKSRDCWRKTKDLPRSTSHSRSRRSSRATATFSRLGRKQARSRWYRPSPRAPRSTSANWASDEKPWRPVGSRRSSMCRCRVATSCGEQSNPVSPRRLERPLPGGLS